MVCPRCITTAESVFNSLDIPVVKTELGMVVTKNDISLSKLNSLNAILQQIGFELITDKKEKIVQQIKDEIITIIHHSNSAPVINLSVHLSDKLDYEYNYLSNLFSENENTTIEKFFIAQRIEKAKELLSYKELSLTEIADTLGYSSSAYLSSQFKKVTGLTITQYIASGNARSNISDL